MSQVGRALLVAGLVIAALGLALTFADRVPFLGRLPGDIRLGDDRVTVHVPIATSILLSIVLTVVLGLVSWLGRR
ncbi:MAG: DUF2905 domain-containing protein [Chloroflexi bacterium]|nr:DUF2905 domain-containing protein [Chloroflexota bacterium]